MLYGSNKWKILIEREDTVYSEYSEIREDYDNEIFGYEETEFLPAFTFMDFSTGRRKIISDIETYITFQS